MLKKWSILNRITESGLVIVVRASEPETAKKIADASLKGGAAAIEITYTVPGATRVIEDLAKSYSDNDIIVGAWTVLDPETARIAILSGAQYVVCPYFNLEIVKLCNRYQVPCMPGAMTIDGVISAMESGADIIKLFPGEAFGPMMIKAIKGPLPQANLMPTGGVNIDNVSEWITAGAVAVGVGGSINSAAKRGDYTEVTNIASQFAAKIRSTREEMR